MSIEFDWERRFIDRVYKAFAKWSIYILTNISQSETDFRKHRFCISTLGSAIYENEKELKLNEKVNLIISLIGCVTGIIGMITGIISLFCWH